MRVSMFTLTIFMKMVEVSPAGCDMHVLGGRNFFTRPHPLNILSVALPPLYSETSVGGNIWRVYRVVDLLLRHADILPLAGQQF